MAVLKRIATSIALLLTVSAITFFMILLVPGDPAAAAAGENATLAQIEEARQRLGLNDNVFVQFFRWLGHASTGNLGQSIQNHVSVSGLVAERFPVTLQLTALAIVIAVLIAVPAAVVAATHKGSRLDRLITTGASAGLAMPSFWLGLVLVIVFALNLSILPSSGFVPISDGIGGWLAHLILPAVTLAAAPAAEITRQLRASMIDVLEQDYIRTSVAKGMSNRVVLLQHALKNAGVPAVTVVGLQLAFMLGGSVIVEQIFGIPGIGSLSVTAVLQRDIPVIQGVVLVAGITVLLVNLLVDLSYRVLSPKMRTA